MRKVEDLRKMFHMEQSPVQRYLRWVGLTWFATYKPADEGLLQGNLGRSMETLESVNAMVGDRILLTVLLSLSDDRFHLGRCHPYRHLFRSAQVQLE